MATRPYIYHPVKSRDIHQRPVKTYKHYGINNESFATSSGYTRYDAIYLGRKYPEVNVGDPTYNYTINSETKVNKHVIWHGIDHRYYDKPFDPTKTQELYDIENTEKFLWFSASVMSIPYFEMGEGIKKESVSLTVTGPGDINYIAKDDGYGNLRDHQIDSSSFASSSRSLLHLSFNDEYRQLRFSQGKLEEAAVDRFKYYFKGAPTNLDHYQKQTNSVYDFNNIQIVNGVRTTGIDQPSGLAARFIDSSSFIRIAHYENGIPTDPDRRSNGNLFDRFGFCDDYTIAFWIKKGSNDTGPYSILSKSTIKRERVYNTADNTFELRDVVYEAPAINQNFDKYRTPFSIGMVCDGSDNTAYHFQASNGSKSLHLSGSKITTTGDVNTSWDHILIRNSNSLAELYINGTLVDSGSLPKGNLGNQYDIVLGSLAAFTTLVPPPPSGSSNVPNPVSSDLTLPTNVTRYSNTDLVINNGITLTVPTNTVLIINGSLTLEDAANIIIEPDAQVYVATNLILNGSAEVTLEGNAELIFDSRVSGDGDIYHNPFDIAELRMYDYAVSTKAINSLTNRHYLSASLYQSSVMGNVFYNQGSVVVTSPLKKHTTGSGVFFPEETGSFDLRYRGIHTIYENEVMVRIPAGKLNVSTNPTATYRKTTKGTDPCLPNEILSMPGNHIKTMFISGTANPYVTTIGLYDRYRQLLAVGKMSQAVQKRPDIDTNIILRWDY